MLYFVRCDLRYSTMKNPANVLHRYLNEWLQLLKLRETNALFIFTRSLQTLFNGFNECEFYFCFDPTPSDSIQTYLNNDEKSNRLSGIFAPSRVDLIIVLDGGLS